MKTILILALLAVACGSETNESEKKPARTETNAVRVEPNYVTVDHILVGVKGDPRMPHVTRTAEEAAALVDEIRAQLEAGASWEDLKQKFSDDRAPGRGARGPYALANRGMNPGNATPRENMVRRFGDVSFSLEVGEIGVADYVPPPSRDCPFGYHIVKRIE